MTYQDIIFTVEGAIARIKFNRPTVMNALSPQLVQELLAAVKTIAADDTIKVMIVTGEGRAWSAGVDLQALNASIQGGQFSADQILKDGLEFINIMQTMPKVAIAQVNGFCFTGALEFMLAFDLVYAAEEAKIGDTHAKWGIAPKWGMTQRLPQKVGILKAHEMSFTAQAISGKEAEKIGLVNKAVPLEKLEETVNQVATQILSNSAQGIAAMKELYYKGMHTTLKEGLDIEYNAHYIINDRQEFLQGFKENKSK
jgi:enoyl-CoA hydratase/carnithine racemase